MSPAPNRAAALARAMRRRLWLARLTLAWERLWRSVWPAAGVAGLFVATALLEIWTKLPGWMHAAALVLFGAGFALALAHGLRRLSLPSEAEAVRRLELASGFDHRPLAALRDRPAKGAGDNLSRRLWRVHLERMAGRARRLRVGLASPGLARHDPLGLRAALLLVLVIAFVAAGGDSGKRLARAFQPDFSATAMGPAVLTLWLTPPDYTGRPPVFLAAGSTGQAALQPAEVTVPSGSAVLARVHGGRGAPHLEIDAEAIAFAAVDSANYELTTTLTAGRRLSVMQDGEALGAWPLEVVADQQPVIEFAGPPGRSKRAALRLDYLAEDDYGLVSVEAIVTRSDDPGQSFAIALPLPLGGATAIEDSSFHDLTPHPWAGLDVTIAFAATDALGQVGTSEPVTTVLPERIFIHPVARRVIEERRKLVLDPTQRIEVSGALHDISRRPDHFFEDLSVYLGLRAARWRLLYDRSDSVVGEIQDLLWDIALTIEDGPIALAEQALREAEQALLDALASDAADSEIDRLVDALLEALDAYLDAMIDQAMSQREMEPSLEDQMMQTVERDQIRDLIEQVRELARTGSRDAARELLEQLQMVLESMRASTMMGMDQQGGSEGQQVLRDLEDLIANQQRLLDETFRLSQGMGDEEGGGAKLGATEQEGLREGLGALMRRWGEIGATIPLPLNLADRAMREALQALMSGMPGQAVRPQTESIDQMRQGAQSILESLLEQMGRAPPRPGGFVGGLGDNLDPLGRGLFGRGYQDDGSTRIPDKADLQRSREILEELYRRAGEFQRPTLERDYIRRLLHRF